MAIVVKDRVKVTTATTGTGTLTLGSAETDFQAFSVIGDGNQTYYAIKSDAGWEVGIGTYTHSGTTLSRDTILESSNSGSAVSLTGTSTVFTTYPAERASFSDQGISKTYVADGAITAGKPCQFTSAGKAEQIATTTSSTTVSGTYSQGTISKIDDVVYERWSMDVASDGTTYGFAYRETAGQTNFVLGTRSGETITWGTPITLASFNSLTQIVKYNPEQDVFIVTYANQTTHKFLATAVSYSGTTATAGSEIELLASAWTSGGVGTGYTQVYDSNSKNNIFICHGANDSLGNQSTAIVITASGTTLTAGSENANTSAGGTYGSACDIGGGKLVYYFRDSTAYYPNVMVLEVSGDTVTFGTTVVVNSGNYGGFCTPVYNPNYTNKAILFGKIYTTDNKYSYASLAISGTTITVSNYSDGNISPDNCYVESYGKVADYSNYTGEYIAVYGDSDDSYKQCNRFCTTTDGETLTVGSENKDSAGASLFYTGVVSNDVNDKSVAYFGDYVNDDIEYYVVNPTYSKTTTTTSTNFDATKYLGVASTTASDTEEVKINLPEGSINNSQSGLTIGDDYFCNTSGEIKKFISSSTSTATTPSSTSNARFGYASYTSDVSSAYDTVNDKIGVLARNYNNYPEVTIGSQSGNTITWGTPVVVSSNSTNATSQRNRLAYANGVFMATYTYGSQGYVCAGEVSGTNSITFGTEVQPNGSNVFSSSTTISYNDDASRWVYGFSLDSSTSIVLFLLTNSGTTISLVSGGSSDATITNAQQNYYNWTNQYDPDTNKTVIGTDYYSGSNNGRIYACTIGASSITVGSSPYSMTGGAYEDGSHELIYDTNQNKWLLLQCNETSNYISGTVITASTDTFSGGTKTVLSSDPARFLASYFDTTKNHIVTGYQYYTTGYYGKMGEISIASTTPSWTDVTATIADQTSERIFPRSAFYNPDTNTGFIAGVLSLTSDDGLAVVIKYTTTTTYTQTDAQYIGEAISTTALKLKETPTDIIFGKASNTIAKGNPVIVEADGDFAKVTSTGGDVAEITAVAFTDTNLGGYGNTQSATSDGKGIIAVAYKNVSPSHSYPTVTLGSMATDGTITWGSERILMSGVVDSENLAVAYAPNYNSDAGGFYISAYRYSNTRQVNYSITYSGTTSTYAGDSAITSLSSTHNGFNSSTFDTTNNKAHVLMLKPYSAMYTISNTSGTTISASSLNYVISGSASSNIQFGNVSYDNTNNTGVIVFRDEGNSDYPTAIAYTISGDTFTFGSKTVIESSACYYIDVQADTGTNKTVVAWGTATSGATIKYVTLDYSGTTITVNTVTTISGYTNHTMNQNNSFLTYSSVSQQFYLAFNRSDLNYILLEGVVNSSDNKLIDWTEKVNRGDTNHNNAFTTYSGKNNLMMLGSYHSNELWSSSYGGAYSDLDSNLTTENFIGFAENAVSANGTSKVRINGVDANNSGLNAGQLYYVKNDATISETAESGKVVEAGKALSATKLLVKG